MNGLKHRLKHFSRIQHNKNTMSRLTCCPNDPKYVNLVKKIGRIEGIGWSASCSYTDRLLKHRSQSKGQNVMANFVFLSLFFRKKKKSTAMY